MSWASAHAGLALLQAGAQDAWEPGAHPLLYVVAETGPWILAGLLALLVLRAIIRRKRYRAVSVLGTADLDALREALRAAEKRTSGEIVSVVLERSDEHPGAAWLCALCSMLIGSALLERFLPWHAPHWLLAWQLVLGATGFVLAHLLPDLRRVFVSEARASEMAEEQALQEFHRAGLRETQGRTGVLLFVSLFERRVVVLGDEGIHGKVGDGHWQKTRDAVLAGIRSGNLAAGLIEGVRACGEELARHFPVAEGDRNELADRVVVRER